MTRRLLQINPVLRTSTSTGRIMQEIADLVQANGWESTIAYSYGRDGVRESASKLIPVGDKLSVALHGLATRLLDRHGLGSKRATEKFVKQIEELDPDIIHIHNIHGYFLHYPTLFGYLARSRAKVVWTVHDCWLYTGHCYYYSYAGCQKWQTGCGKCPQKRSFPTSWLADRSARNFRDKREAFTSVAKDRMVIVPVSEWMRGEMSKSFLKEYPFRVIHNGINTEVFAPREAADVKARYGLEGKRTVIVGLASIWSREKGLDDFVEMAGMLGDDEAIVLVGLSEEQMKGLPKGIVGIRRTENVGQLAELYSAATAFVNPTWQDNYPTVNLEAIACGTPVVTYRTGGSVEAVTEDTGVVVEQGDVAGLLEAVREIAAKGKGAYTQKCREHALANFRKEDRYRDYLELYEELLKK